MAYGPRSNADLLLYSGFVDSSHCLNDQVQLWMALGSGLEIEQLKILEMMEYPM
jgi:hypothetical protein